MVVKERKGIVEVICPVSMVISIIISAGQYMHASLSIPWPITETESREVKVCTNIK